MIELPAVIDAAHRTLPKYAPAGRHGGAPSVAAAQYVCPICGMSLELRIAAGVLYPAFGLLLSPMLAAAAMSLSSLSVIANALRLRRLTL